MIRGLLRSKVLWVLLAAVVVAGMSAQEPEHRRSQGVPEDWTHHHLLFSIDYLRSHPEIANREPRAMHQLYRRFGRLLAADQRVASNVSAGTQGDWTKNLGAGVSAAGTSPAKYVFDPTQPPSCTADWIVLGINAAGATGGQATLVALSNLYVGEICATGPSFKFAYNTSTLTNGRVQTSPVLSVDGTKVAFIESSPTGSALHVLKYGTGGVAGGNGTSATASAFPGTGNNAKMVSITYTSANNTHSSPWVDYTSDSLYVGADNGQVYKFTGVFLGTPTLVTTGGWPVTVNTTAVQLTGPVLDSPGTGNLFVGDVQGALHSFNAITPGAVRTLAVGKTFAQNSQILDAPIVDGYGNVFATSSNDGTSAVVVQASTANLSQIARVRIGPGSTLGTSILLYDGDFDNAYYNSQSTGHYMLCSNGGGGNDPYRYSLSFSGGIVQADATPVQISTSNKARCGPFTDFFNPNIGGGTDYFFWGVTSNCVGTSGCLMSLANGTTVTTHAQAGGTTSVVVDNESATDSHVYYSSQAVPRQVVQVTQSGLN